ncbi:MAG: Smr/MutS family protein [Rickettsiales bacterium]|jgi:DNA-nicking Smr family endonuclease|nr:Smr/MutS family protein [Rickettsiales bacterium]
MPESFKDELKRTEFSFITSTDVPKMRGRSIRENDIRIGDFSRTDGGTRERMRKGRLEPERTLDLHGRTVEAAHRAFIDFINSNHAASVRNLLVITGKGALSKEGKGRIRKEFEAWINDPLVGSKILAVAPAGPSHGGGGAFYILLRKK